MGTSQSSGGAPSGVPMVPSWTPEPPAEDVDVAGPAQLPDAAIPSDPLSQSAEGEDTGSDSPEVEPVPESAEASDNGTRPAIPFAGGGRFSGARLNLGAFARGGGAADMRKGLGRFVRSGYGGARTAVRRFGGTTATAEALAGALAALAASERAGSGDELDPLALAGRSASEVMDAVVDAVRPVDGTLDAEAGRASIRDALSETLKRFPEADLLSLGPEARAFAMESFTASEVFRRVDLDLGKHVRAKSVSIAACLARLKEIRDYIRETVAAAFRRLRDSGRGLTVRRVGEVVRDALFETFQVFEGYA